MGNSKSHIKQKWYVAQVPSGKEAETLERCRRCEADGVLSDSFLPEHEVMRKTGDGWRPMRSLLFPGYIFFVTDDVASFSDSLKRSNSRARLLGSDDCPACPLSNEERDWLAAFMDGEHVVRMSEGVIEGDEVRVTKGPLMGLEGCIGKIDRHKRRACIEVTMFGRPVNASVGLEIVRKTDL